MNGNSFSSNLATLWANPIKLQSENCALLIYVSCQVNILLKNVVIKYIAFTSFWAGYWTSLDCSLPQIWSRCPCLWLHPAWLHWLLSLWYCSWLRYPLSMVSISFSTIALAPLPKTKTESSERRTEEMILAVDTNSSKKPWCCNAWSLTGKSGHSPMGPRFCLSCPILYLLMNPSISQARPLPIILPRQPNMLWFILRVDSIFHALQLPKHLPSW